MKFKFVMSRQTDRSIVHEGSVVTESSLKIASRYMKEGYFKEIWIEDKDGTKIYLSLDPISNVPHDAMSDHE